MQFESSGSWRIDSDRIIDRVDRVDTAEAFQRLLVVRD